MPALDILNKLIGGSNDQKCPECPKCEFECPKIPECPKCEFECPKIPECPKCELTCPPPQCPDCPESSNAYQIMFFVLLGVISIHLLLKFVKKMYKKIYSKK